MEGITKNVGPHSVVPAMGILAVGAYWIYCLTSKPGKPNGPKGFPFVGCATQLGAHPAKTLSSMASKFGNIFSIQIGTRNYVILNKEDAIKEALMRKEDDFSGRPNLPLMKQMCEGMGLIFRNYGPECKRQKKFVVRTLRKFGVGKQRLEDLINEEMNFLSERISSKNGVPFNLKNLMAKATGNIVNVLLLGSRMAYDNPVYSKLVGTLDSTFFNEITAPEILALLVAPILRYLPSFHRTYNKFQDDLTTTFSLLGDILETHKSNLCEDDEERDLVSSFLKTMKSKENNDGSFKERQVFQLLRELFVAGTANISIVIRWCILALMNNPHYQEKIYDEIITVIGECGVPSAHHKEKMPFTSAFITEILRHRTLAPLGIPHCTMKDTTVNGFPVPKHTPVLVNLWSATHDPEYFDNPDEFQPERFLDENGEYERNPHVINFSFGARFCVGEQIARTSIFLFLVGMVQKYRIVPDEMNPPADFNEGVHGLLYAPKNFNVSFLPR